MSISPNQPSFMTTAMRWSLLAALVGCVAQANPPPAMMNPNELPDFPLSGTARGEEIPNSMLPSEGKMDDRFPARFDLVAGQSPVRNQASRGVCTIFSSIGLMEALYIKAGLNSMPDFSEQYLQWSTKVQAGQYTWTEGSNNDANLRAVSRFGIPAEGAWPYQSYPWGANDDPRCGMPEDQRPTICFTNGDAPESARMAQMFRLPSPRRVSSTIASIKGHMVSTGTPVVVGLDFFYQAWSHRRSTIPVYGPYMAQGNVLYPSQEDVTASRMQRAGHGILLVGWDDEHEVQAIDAQGNLRVDAAGQPVMQRGFFLFKNSWGTDRFGTQNQFGPGYGWIQYEYVEDYADAVVAGLPQGPPPVENCTDGVDNDNDRLIDCEDTSCTAHPSCSMMPLPTTTVDSAMPNAMIPDNSAAGVTSTITVERGGAIRRLTVAVDITHTYRGDLVVELRRSGRTVPLWSRQGNSADDLRQSFTRADFDGQDAAGEWTLFVRDAAGTDVGTLNRWTVTVER